MIYFCLLFILSRQRPGIEIMFLYSGCPYGRSVTVVMCSLLYECSPSGAPEGFSPFFASLGGFGRGGHYDTPPCDH
jgi:hypothetical protein